MMWVLLLLMLSAVGADPAAVKIESWLNGSPQNGVGTLTVQVEIPAELEIQWPEPDSTGLRFTELGSPQSEVFGDATVIRRQYRFSGQPGHYEIPALTVRWGAGEASQSVSSKSIFVDLEKDPPRTGELIDIVEPAGVWVVPWWVWWLLGVALVGVLAMIGGGVLFSRWNAVDAPVEVIPADILAIRQWELAYRDPDMDEYTKAVEISRIFREYTESVMGFAASAWTTSEILQRLSSMPHLKKGNVPRAKRLLRATDRIKFADASVVDELFENLDSDLRGFVGSTRTVKWGER
jgi:hypothetical protein